MTTRFPMIPPPFRHGLDAVVIAVVTLLEFLAAVFIDPVDPTPSRPAESIVDVLARIGDVDSSLLRYRYGGDVEGLRRLLEEVVAADDPERVVFDAVAPVIMLDLDLRLAHAEMRRMREAQVLA